MEITKPLCFVVLPAVPRRPEALNNGVGANNARTCQGTINLGKS